MLKGLSEALCKMGGYLVFWYGIRSSPFQMKQTIMYLDSLCSREKNILNGYFVFRIKLSVFVLLLLGDHPKFRLFRY